jgi:hypothetical protein
VKRPRSDASGPFLAKKRIFPVIFRGKSHDAGEFGSEKFSTGIDLKRVKNNLQGLRGNLYPGEV